MAWDGDISKMGQLAANLEKLARVPSRAAATVARSIATLIDEEFAQETDPYGNAWKPHAPATVERHGEHSILDLSGSMYRSVDVHPMRGSGVAVTIDHPGEDHQTGWSGPQGAGPARPVLPGNTFPARWKEAVDSAINAQVREAVGR